MNDTDFAFALFLLVVTLIIVVSFIGALFMAVTG